MLQFRDIRFLQFSSAIAKFKVWSTIGSKSKDSRVLVERVDKYHETNFASPLPFVIGSPHRPVFRTSSPTVVRRATSRFNEPGMTWYCHVGNLLSDSVVQRPPLFVYRDATDRSSFLVPFRFHRGRIARRARANVAPRGTRPPSTIFQRYQPPRNTVANRFVEFLFQFEILVEFRWNLIEHSTIFYSIVGLEIGVLNRGRGLVECCCDYGWFFSELKAVFRR